uniref:Galectin n=1 Tax=Panagrolaimus superbus TaxID=310955 RepID=A0A914Y7E5_9BILA
MTEIISDPILPFVTNIPGGIFPGKAITIRGSSSSAHPHQFSIDLCCGLLVQGDHQDNKALHFNPRFIKKKGIFGSADEDIVLNSLINNKWGAEERTGNCLRSDGPFTIRILILQSYFKIAVNGKHLADFVHRIPYTSINTLFIQGAARIDVIEFEGSVDESSTPTENSEPIAIGHGGTSTPASPTGPSADAIIRKPDVPFVHSFRAGSLNHTKTITLTATPKMHATIFTFNLMKSGDYFFHLRVDFPHHGKSNGALVRNHCINNRWASEERVISKFPFTQGITFDLIISLGSEFLTAELDGQRIFTFNYRPGIYLNEVNIVSITGDLNVQKFELK